MALDSRDDSPDDTPDPIPHSQFEREQDDFFVQSADPANNPEGRLFTKSFSVEMPESLQQMEHTDIIETVSPDIHIFTTRLGYGYGEHFTLNACGTGVSCIVNIDTKDLSTAKEVHMALVAKFEETRSMVASLQWLVGESKYADIKGRSDEWLLMFIK